eukprot:585436-Hanusia_phi.AAC.1
MHHLFVKHEAARDSNTDERLAIGEVEDSTRAKCLRLEDGWRRWRRVEERSLMLSWQSKRTESCKIDLYASLSPNQQQRNK